MTHTNFIAHFLGIKPEEVKEQLINGKMVADIMEAYVAHLEKQKADAILNVSNIEAEVKQAFSDLVVFGKAEVDISNPKGTRLQINGIEINPVRTLVWDWKNSCWETEPTKTTSENDTNITSPATKYPNLLNNL